MFQHVLSTKRRISFGGISGSICLIVLTLLYPQPTTAQTEWQTQIVQAGDTWATLALRFDTTPELLHEANRSILTPLNPMREPAIGATIALPSEEVAFGRMLRPKSTSPTLIALTQQIHPKQFTQPYLIPFQAILLHDQSTPIRDLPPALSQLELSHTPAIPGQAFALRGISSSDQLSITLHSAEVSLPFDTFYNEAHVVALRGTGAFFDTGTTELTIESPDTPLWSQPYLFIDQRWDFQDLTLTGTAAQIDRTSIQEERARLFEIWEVAGNEAQFSAEFALPIRDFLNYSSAYGARRSYNGGGYNSYHEGVDFSAYGGTPVFATNRGTVVVAETLFVRGGAVVIDHGLGIYSGVYHLSEVLVTAGDIVEIGQPIGAVGTTGLSTGNHLHWDFLVTETWVDAGKWTAQGMGCWILTGLNLPCQ